MYLANRGIKTANVPIVKDLPVPENLETLDGPVIVGLTAASSRLVQIRRNRLLALNEDSETSYVNSDEVKKEIIFARRLYESNGWPVIDVSRRSIEETAAAVLNLYSQHQADKQITQ